MVIPDQVPSRPDKPSSLREAVLILSVGLTLIAAVVWLVVKESPHFGARERGASAPASGRQQRGPYIGSHVCGECHPGELASFTRSGHANTLREAARLPLARRLDGRVLTDPEHSGVTWTYALGDDKFQVERKEFEKIQKFIIGYAFGSDHHATTFVTLTDPSKPTAMEHRLTHYKESDSLAITPGQRAEHPSEGTTLLGRNLNPAETMKCFRCHSTRTSAVADQGFDVKDLIPNVSCERCHGPARAHVAAAHAGREDLSMPFGNDNWTAESQLKFCGQCHRHPSKATPGLIRPDNSALARFQPVGLSQSKCYTRGGGKMSCVTCHDPHRRASSDRSSYETSCLKCHETESQARCPVSPQSGCIDCHMPKVDSGQRVLFTDHWIRIRPNAHSGSP